MEKYCTMLKKASSFDQRLGPIPSSDPNFSHKDLFSKSDRLQTEPNAVRLGDYMHRRKFSKSKKIVGQVKSIQFVEENDPKTKQLQFQRDNLVRLCEKISLEIGKRVVEINQMGSERVKEEEKVLEKMLEILAGGKSVGNAKGQCSSTFETSVSSNGLSMTSAKGFKTSFARMGSIQEINKMKNLKDQQHISLKLLQEVPMVRIKEDIADTLPEKVKEEVGEPPQSPRKKQVGFHTNLEIQGQSENEMHDGNGDSAGYGGSKLKTEGKYPSPAWSSGKLKCLLTPKYQTKKAQFA